MCAATLKRNSYIFTFAVHLKRFSTESNIRFYGNVPKKQSRHLDVPAPFLDYFNFVMINSVLRFLAWSSSVQFETNFPSQAQPFNSLLSPKPFPVILSR